MSTDIRRPQRLNLTQQCAESMKQHMMLSALKAGDRLPSEQEWVEMLGVSRLVVREALQLLAGSGLIDVQQGRGAFVREITDISVFDQLTFGLNLHELSYTDVFEARAMLELTILELCMHRATPDDIAELDSIIDEMQCLLEQNQPFEELHRSFHRRMLQAAKNPLIERVGLALLDLFWRIGDSLPSLVFPLPHNQGYDMITNHRLLLDAIRTHDLARSRELVFQHLPIQTDVKYIFPLEHEQLSH